MTATGAVCCGCRIKDHHREVKLTPAFGSLWRHWQFRRLILVFNPFNKLTTIQLYKFYRATEIKKKSAAGRVLNGCQDLQDRDAATMQERNNCEITPHADSKTFIWSSHYSATDCVNVSDLWSTVFERHDGLLVAGES